MPVNDLDMSCLHRKGVDSHFTKTEKIGTRFHQANQDASQFKARGLFISVISTYYVQAVDHSW